MMYVSIRRYKTSPDLVDELMVRVEDGFVPMVKEVPGFVAYYGVDAGDGVVAFVNFFEDREGAERSNELAAFWTREDVATLFPLPPDITGGGIKVRRTRAEVGGDGEA